MLQNKASVQVIQSHLLAMQDMNYKDFHKNLIPTVPEELIIGVRTPQLRKYAKQLAGTPEAEEFLQSLPHHYYEENNLHGFLLESIKDYDRLIVMLDEFLPFVDNWATCDMMRPKVFAKHTDKLIGKIWEWMEAEDTYTIRFGIEMLMSFYLDEKFDASYLEPVAALRSEEYYIRMMVAWFFATALAKQWDAVIPYIEERKLDTWTHNKAIQKACESYRITPEQKEYLKTLKV